MNQTLDLTLLCKVVDNFGDIGVVYRLARALSDICKGGACPSLQTDGFPLPPLTGTPRNAPISLKLRIVIDNLKSFSLLEPKINPEASYQKVNDWEIFQWDDQKLCLDAFQKNPPHVIFECFQCGRPDWLENLLFDIKVPNITNIIMLDYLTAEDYAETFHKLQSLTRSSRVKKVNFMPGFTNKTGGLILDEPFIESLKSSTISYENQFNAVFFSYPRDWTPAINALEKFNLKKANGKLKILLAKGAGFESFKEAYDKAENINFPLEALPFLPQTEWDKLLCNTPLLFIRGEDSLSRACLCGHPFIWHAYPQTEEYQLVKVQALLDRMRLHFSCENFQYVEKCWQIYNQTNPEPAKLEQSLTEFLLHLEELKSGFAEFSRSLLENGDLAKNLLDFSLEQAGVTGSAR